MKYYLKSLIPTNSRELELLCATELCEVSLTNAEDLTVHLEGNRAIITVEFSEDEIQDEFTITPEMTLDEFHKALRLTLIDMEKLIFKHN